MNTEERLKKMQAEIERLKKRLREEEDATLRERLRQLNKAAGIPDNTMGIP